MTKIKCSSCNELTDSDSEFCPNCGKKLHSSKTQRAIGAGIGAIAGTIALGIPGTILGGYVGNVIGSEIKELNFESIGNLFNIGGDKTNIRFKDDSDDSVDVNMEEVELKTFNLDKKTKNQELIKRGIFNKEDFEF